MTSSSLPADLFCPNPACALHGKVKGRRLGRHGSYGADQRPRYRCKACGKTFAATRGTVFYRLRTDPQRVLATLEMVVEQGGIRAAARASHVDKDTVQQWLERAGQHALEVSDALIRERHLSEGQLDALWTFVKKKRGGLRRRTTPSKWGTSG